MTNDVHLEIFDRLLVSEKSVRIKMFKQMSEVAKEQAYSMQHFSKSPGRPL